MRKHFEMAVKVIHERIHLDQQRVSADVAEILGIIDANLFNPNFKINSLHLTKEIRASFSEVFDATVGLYARVRKIEVALFLLDYTDGKIPAIAKLVGYPNPYSFNYTFKKMMGRSPTAERRHWRENGGGGSIHFSRDPADGRRPLNPRIHDAPIDRRCLIGALAPHSAAFRLCHLRYGASEDVDEVSWLDDWMDQYLETVEGDPKAVPELPDLHFKTEALSPTDELELLRQAAQPTLKVLDTYETSVPKSLQSMVTHLRANIITPDYRLDQLQDEIGAYHADRVEFSQFMGITPRQYLFEGRMETASRLLRDNPLSVTVIAQLMGYADPPQFRRAFKVWSGGLSPDEYRTWARYTAARVGPAPAMFINWRYLEHIREEAPKEALELVRYLEWVYSFSLPEKN